MSVIEPYISPETLISFIVDHCAHPTTLVVGSTSDQFIQQWHDGRDSQDDDDRSSSKRGKTTLLEVAIARHIRVVFVPTVAHLRGFLAAFDPAASRIPAPPTLHKTKTTSKSKSKRQMKSKLIVYSLLRLHRDTSEWSAQGLGTTAVVLDEAGWRTGMDVVVVEGRSNGQQDGQQRESVGAWSERVPVLSTSARRQLEKAGYALRTERIQSVMERWFTLKAELVGDEAEDDEEVEEHEADATVVDAEAEPKPAEDTREPEEPNTEVPVPGDGVVPREVDPEAEEAEAEAPAPLESPPRRPVRTFVKDSEDEDDDDLSDDY
ncbi:hypothetical protein F503_01861 [Ophiostoma piceae UAMH 11346]|uniref:Uncharacterized protein n=1 Tax=Ophiostoma piceae (strain UAMH 11346) TaxID=1262450 RepID=S3CBG9_OPHP1|nr:hypothetical protein F503_01861 [Ophiostoma piceae UAMH 11346]